MGMGSVASAEPTSANALRKVRHELRLRRGTKEGGASSWV
jgi:hypothetical protein